MRTYDTNNKTNEILIPKVNLKGDICIPMGAKAIVLFAHGSGSSRHSTRNQYIAHVLNSAGFATLLVDLLTQEEKEIDNKTRHIRFDVNLLASRLKSVTSWLLQEPETHNLTIGYFGSSTGAAAAILAAVKFNDIVKAIVTRGGRPDLVEDRLQTLMAATLFIVGSLDNTVKAINRRALNGLVRAEAKELVVIPGAGHLFEEPGKMEEVTRVAVDWFEVYLLRTGKKKLHRRHSRNGVARIFLPISQIRPVLGLRFRDRMAAGQMLATLLPEYKNETPVIIGIPRGGVIVADAMAEKLSYEFDIVVSRRLRDPVDSENAIGAVMQDGSVYLDQSLIASRNLSEEFIEAEKQEQKKEIDRRLAIYGREAKEYRIKNRTVILVDDGAATGATLAVAARWIRQQQPKRLVIAVPVISPRAINVLANEADQLEFIRNPSNFVGVEQFYHDFRPISDEQVMQIIKFRC
jgi:putative phosphoribosyl transferase